MSEEPNRLDDFAHRTRTVVTTAVTRDRKSVV